MRGGGYAQTLFFWGGERGCSIAARTPKSVRGKLVFTHADCSDRASERERDREREREEKMKGFSVPPPSVEQKRGCE